MATILGNANAILSVPNALGVTGPITDYIITQTGNNILLFENGVDLMIHE
jgi:hypothetical protein|tara:strand:+ start:429 stop:578 length:150 start_codon:yes stop_codon:yes gene_type:complete